MPVPTVYSEAQLQQYMLAQTGNLGTVLGLSASDFVEAVTDALIAYGVTAIASATDIAKLRALATLAAWQVAVQKAAGYMEFTADGSSFKANQIHQQALASLAQAEQTAAVYGALAGYVVTTATLTWPDDPYPLPRDDET